MILDALTILVAMCALLPAVLFCINLREYRPPPEVADLVLPMVSVLIPARNEERGITAAITSVLASSGVSFEVIVMDDCSTDRTSSIVQAMANIDRRISLVQAPILPSGWNGKQHACWGLARAGKGDLLCFVDADVRLAPEALARMAAFLVRERVSLVSGFPQQLTKTWMEWLLLPLIHFVLLGFLPLSRMRKRPDPSLAAGCGQFMMVDRVAYFAAGGHTAIRQTMHDGLLLPRLLREFGYRTDLADLTELATCRMYTNATEVWQGLAKNATEGVASPGRIVPVSMFLLLGQVVPIMLVVWLLFAGRGHSLNLAVGLLATTAMWLPRILAMGRFRQDWRGMVFHPVGILTLLVLQWYAFLRKLSGRAVSWRERTYTEA